MRGKTAKRIHRFVAKLIAETPSQAGNKSYRQMVSQVKRFWRTNKKTHGFIDYVLSQG